MAERRDITPDEWLAIRDDANWRHGPCFELRLFVAEGCERVLTDALMTDRVIVARVEEQPSVQIADEIESCDVVLRLGSLPAMGFRIIGLKSKYVEVVTYPGMVANACGPDAIREMDLVPPKMLELHASLIALAGRVRGATGPLRAEIGWEGEGGGPEMNDGLVLAEDVAAGMRLRTSASMPPFVGISWEDCGVKPR